MQKQLTTIDTQRLQKQLERLSIACCAAIELGDSHAVARFTCELARLRNWISLAPGVRLEAA